MGETETLQSELETLRGELEKTKQALQKSERQLEKSQSYSEELRQQIETLSAEVHRYRSAAQNRKDAECQVKEEDIKEAYGDKPFPVWGVPESESSNAKDADTQNPAASIAESLKAAAEEVVWEQAGFVYDSQSGHYYDYNSGYYYDPTRSLYYDPRTCSYFYYDEEAREYKFHSYASTQQTQDQMQSHTTVSQDGASASQDTQSIGETKSKKSKSKKKDKEKPKGHKRKRTKERRRTKESKHKKKKKKKSEKDVDKDEEFSKVNPFSTRGLSALSSGEPSGAKRVKSDEVVMVDSSDEEDAHQHNGESDALSEFKNRMKNKRTQNEDEKGEIEETMEVEEEEAAEAIYVESSDSLATGESELESEPESGELSSSSSSESESEEEDDQQEELVEYEGEEAVEEPEISANWPPCVRVVVQKSDVVGEGTFFLVTCMGGTIGREKDSKHVIQLPDINISKVHAEIKFDYDNKCYTVQDLGSQNGTFVNDLRISETKVQSAAVPLCHGDTLQVASTLMLLHIHPGSDTCDDCEPGQVQAALRARQTVFNDHVVLTKEEKKQQARKQLKQIKKKYGLANAGYVDNVAAIKNPQYADKADLRRKFVGSEHDSHKQREEAPASVHRPISTENKGHRMLAKMGWKEGSGLGKDNAGIAEPVSVELRANQTAGLGSGTSVNLSLDDVQSARKAQRWAQTQQRYHSLDKGNSSASVTDSLSKVQDSGDSQTVSAGADTNSGASQGASGAKIQFQWIKGGTHKPP